MSRTLRVLTPYVEIVELIAHTIPLSLLLLLADDKNKTVSAYKVTGVAINSNAFKGFPR